MAYQSDKGINDTRAVTRQNARIKAELNEQAHGARMSEFDALLVAYTDAYELYALGSLSGPALTQARNDLRVYVQTMSRRIKLR